MSIATRPVQSLTTRIEQGWYGGVWITFDHGGRVAFARKFDTDTARQLGIELMRQADLTDERNQPVQS